MGARWIRRLLAATAILTVMPATAGAQAVSGVLRGQAEAASQMIVLGVQQGISSLPPTTGQSFAYEYNPELGTFVASEQLGPTVLRAPQTIGANRLSVRAAASYFDLSKTFSPISYRINVPPNNAGFPSPLFAQLGMSANADVSLLNFGATYGITDRVELMVNVPVSVVEASANATYSSTSDPSTPPSQQQLGVLSLGSSSTPQQVDQAFQQAYHAQPPTLFKNTSNYTALGFNGFNFNNGAQAGVGRISVGVKALVYDNDALAVAFAPEFFCNSPNEAQFAGSNSQSILPRIIGQWTIAKHLRAHTDIGYEHDFEVNQLSRFVWNSGLSLPLRNVTFDTGVGGSKFESPIQWTPAKSKGFGPPSPGDYPNGIPVTLAAVDPGATKLGTNYVDYLFGVKVRLSPLLTEQAAKLFEGTVLSGAVNVPITSDGFRAAAVGTVALEYYF